MSSLKFPLDLIYMTLRRDCVHNTCDALRDFPVDVSLRLLSYLNATNLAVIHVVSKRWHLLTKDPVLLQYLDMKILFRHVSVIDADVWASHCWPPEFGLVFNSCATDQTQLIPQLKKSFLWPVETIDGVGQGVTAIDLPQGLTINKLLTLAPHFFPCCPPLFIATHGTTPVSHAYKIIMTNNVMINTKNKTDAQQLLEIEKYGARRPKAVEVLARFILNHLRGLPDEEKNGRSIYTRCEERVNGESVVIGTWDDNRIHVQITSDKKYGLVGCLEW